ncbi:MAG TPA: AIR synthase-related protein, partial [Pirellulaceae bacterium]|nr:AIR synthase-related protein [Pirellulaceae bacterium]
APPKLAAPKIDSVKPLAAGAAGAAGGNSAAAGARNPIADEQPLLIHVLPKPGVMDPVAQSAQQAIADFGFCADAVRTFTKYWVSGITAEQTKLLCQKILANDSVEQVVVGPLQLDKLQFGSPYQFRLQNVPIRELDDAALQRLSKEGQLYLTLVEMQTIQQYFRDLGRDPTDAELESVAQTWSEHCSHKTLAGRIAYRDEKGSRRFDNMLKETIFAATQQIRRQLGDADWCVSVFKDNAGVVRFDDKYNVVFKVETHNHPSAIEPYGGANTGLGGVIRDPLGTGLGAKPVCNTDVFCFAPPETPADSLPPGVLHPRRVMKGVVSGVRDYGNRMGIPTVNGAVYFDPRYLGNPLVYCGNVGLIPRDKSFKKPLEGDWVVAVGGRTGRDGIHGATFSSAELTSESESISGGAVQIGNAITEKMVLDVLLAARDRQLFNAVTDCGAGGFSSAVGEMGEEIGAEVWLDKAPLKYDGLSYTEIWISEAQERMILAVSQSQWDEFHSLCAAEGVEATIIGQFVPTGRLQLKYHGEVVADLSMKFLHEGRPPVVRDAVYTPPPAEPLRTRQGAAPPKLTSQNAGEVLKSILGSLNVASKEWVIRQYDHEVQGGSVIKPLVGVTNDGP